MSILSQHTTRAEAATIARELKARGYEVKAKHCYEYVPNVVRYAAGVDAEATVEVAALVTMVMGGYRVEQTQG